MKVILATLALALLAGTARADSTWSYQGNALDGTDPAVNGGSFPSCACALSGSITLNAAGLPIAWNFTDGTHTLNQSDSIMYSFTEQYNFLHWYVNILGSNGTDFFSNNLYDPFYSVDWASLDGGVSVIGLEGGHPGAWTDPTTTPEPGTLALLGVGLAALALRRKKRLDTTVWEPLA